MLLKCKINVKSTKSRDFVLLIYNKVEYKLFSLNCCVVAVAAERLVDVSLAEDHEFVAL